MPEVGDHTVNSLGSSSEPLETEITVKMTSEKFLCLFYLIGIAGTVYSIPMYETAAVDDPLPTLTGCSVDSLQPHTTALVAFVHGEVFDEQGQQIVAGSELQPEAIVTVASDGFLALHISDSKSVNIQPDTSTSIACALATQLPPSVIAEPFRLGAIRG